MLSIRHIALGITTLAVGLSAALPNVALARRLPTKSERAAIAHAMHVPPRCALIWVSTVDSSWARSEDRLALPEVRRRHCLRYVANGIAILHRTHARWRPVIEFSSISCPVPHVPARVAKDLRVPCNPGVRANGQGFKLVTEIE